MLKKIIIGLGIWDLHHALHDKKLFLNILKVIEDLKPNVFILGGDNMNMTAVNHWLHEEGRIRELEGKRVKADYESFNKDILIPLKKVLPRGCRKIWLNGNHEDWITLAIDQNPQGEGYWEIEKNLDLDDWEFYKYGKFARVGKIYIIHGQYTNQYHSKKTVDIFEKNILYGHNHTLQIHTKITPVGNEAHSGISVPCACDANPDYMRNKPSAWVNGFVVFYIMPDGNFNIYPIVATKGHFVFNGKFY